MTHKHAKGQGQRSFDSKVKSGNRWTDRQNKEVIVLPPVLMQSVNRK